LHTGELDAEMDLVWGGRNAYSVANKGAAFLVG
jgi:hypothetical protein